MPSLASSQYRKQHRLRPPCTAINPQQQLLRPHNIQQSTQDYSKNCSTHPPIHICTFIPAIELQTQLPFSYTLPIAWILKRISLSSLVFNERAYIAKRPAQSSTYSLKTPLPLISRLEHNADDECPTSTAGVTGFTTFGTLLRPPGKWICNCNRATDPMCPTRISVKPSTTNFMDKTLQILHESGFNEKKARKALHCPGRAGHQGGSAQARRIPALRGGRPSSCPAAVSLHSSTLTTASKFTAHSTKRLPPYCDTLMRLR